MPACSLVRGTSTRQPNSGLVSNQDSAVRRSTTSPITVTAGGVMRDERTSAPTRARVETRVSCSVVVPTRVIATGVSGSRPAATSALAMSPTMFTPERTTSVRWSPYADQSTFSFAVTTATSRWSLVVSGMPA